MKALLDGFSSPEQNLIKLLLSRIIVDGKSYENGNFRKGKSFSYYTDQELQEKKKYAVLEIKNINDIIVL